MEFTNTTELKKELGIVDYIASIVNIIVGVCLFLSAWVMIDQLVKQTADKQVELTLLQLCLGMLALFLPLAVEKILKTEVPTELKIIFPIFVFCAIFLGEVFKFYFRVPHWDTMLHLLSAYMLASFGAFLFQIILSRYQLNVDKNSGIVLAMALFFAVSVGVFWEFYEFSFDHLLGFNLQKAILQDGTPLVGHNALLDTMKDLIVDFLGASLYVVVGLLGKLKLNQK